MPRVRPATQVHDVCPMESPLKTHPVLARLLDELGLVAADAPRGWHVLLDRVTDVLVGAEEDRDRLNDTVASSSAEMLALGASLSTERDGMKTILTSIGEALCVLDAMGQITFANPSAAKLLGTPELVGRTFSQFINWNGDADELFVADSDTLMTEAFGLLGIDGAPIDVSLMLTPLVANDTNGASVVTFRDVRERRRADLALRASESRLRAIFESATVGLAQTALDGTIVDCNDTYARMVGYERSELVGKVEYTQPSHPDDPASAVPAGLGDGEGKQLERKYLHRDGSAVTAAVSLVVVNDAAGSPVFNFAMVRDLTEQRKLEVTLRQAQKLESVGRLAAGVAHEINTPIQYVADNLAFVGSAIERLLALYKGARALVAEGNDEALGVLERVADLEFVATDAPRAVSDALEGTTQVAAIVRAMKVLSHQQHDGEQRSIDLHSSLQSVLTVARCETRLVADVVLDLGGTAEIVGYGSELNQVFLNLVVNAAHAIADVVAGTDRRGTITISAADDGPDVVVTVGDTGAGIPEAVRNQIFDPFFTTKDVGQGTGQGLAIARAIIVDKHGGALTFESEVGKGTTFFVRVPRAGSARAKAA